ncbi:MFS transporter [uncultured Anaerotruncus sp.]|uniref:MFS transporter n=1 Tax=uncultured Anaerotruncus sp. TaxID=905011 RepID=UPI00280B2AE7|nr:MFS transporter [uncultured Anaerotruncus sp.]
MTVKKSADPRLLLFAGASFAAIIAYAFGFNILGPNAVVMMDYFGIRQSGQGLVMAVQSSGELLVSALLVVYGERFGKLALTALGVGLLSAACLAIGAIPLFPSAIPPYGALLFFAALLGASFSLINTMVNASIPEVFSDRRDLFHPLVHSFYSAGAMCAPFLVTLLVNEREPHSYAVPFLAFGGYATLVLCFYLISVRLALPLTPYAAPAKAVPTRTSGSFFVFRQPKIWLLSIVMLSYISFSISVGSWLPAYCSQFAHMSFRFSGLILTVFNCGALVMRFFFPLVLRRIDFRRYFIAAGLLSSACMLAALLLRGDIPVAVFVALSGFFQGGMGLCLFMLCNSVFPGHSGSVSAFVILIGGLANTLAPYFMGKAADLVGFRIPFLCIVALLAFSALLLRAFIRGGVVPEA